MKDLKISKELICEVLKLKPTSEFNYYIEDNYIIISDFGEQLFEVNIYEFAFKCKEWGSYKGHTLSSTYYPHNNCICYIDITTKNFKQFEADTEIETIINACNWIFGAEQ